MIDKAIFDGKEFRFNHVGQCQIFETLLEQFNTSDNTKVSPCPSIQPFNLTEAFNKFITSAHYQENNLGRRLFSLIFDIKLAFYFLEIESSELWGIENQINANIANLKEPTTVVEAPMFFPACMALQKRYPIYILRYRAVWDKILDLLALYFAKQELKGDSKLKPFTKMAEKNADHIPPDFVDGLKILLDNFSNKFRTSEAHGAGVFRKWSFLINPRSHSSPTDLLTVFSNSLNFAVMVISQAVLYDEPMPKNPHDGKGYFWVLREIVSKPHMSG